MPSGRVPLRLTSPSPAAVKSGATVAGNDWTAAAGAYNGILGSDSALIPYHVPQVSIAAAGSQAFSYTIWPRYQATHRLWIVSAQIASGIGTFTFTDPSGGVTSATISSIGSGRAFFFYETISSRSSAERQVSAAISVAAGSSTVIVYGIGCWEIPRADLVVGASNPRTADAGVVVESLAPGFNIDDSTTGTSLGAIPRGLDSLRYHARRTGLFAAAPFASSTSSTFANVLQAPPAVLGRKLYAESTQGIMQIGAVVRSSDSSTTGEVKVSMTSGASIVIPIPAGAVSGVVMRDQIAIDCEDLSTSDGRRASRDDLVTIQLRRSSGAGTVYLDCINGGEADPTTLTLATIAAGSATAGQRIRGRGPLARLFPRRRNA